MSEQSATVIARANIALAKYWGKSDVALNLPAVASISVTLEPMRTETTVTFDEALKADEVSLNGKAADGKPKQRAIKVLDQVRALAKRSTFARVESANNFPTASGLASSASGFAALVAAAWSAADLPRDDNRWSAMSRQASASAARSIYGGFVELPKGVPGNAALAARVIAPADHWDVRIVVAVANEGPKDTGSTEGMTHSERTSPYYRAWVDSSDALVEEVRAGILARDLTKVGEAMEQSTLAMHACMMASRPGLIYLQPATLSALATVKQLRKEGVEVYATMDAGPHVKALCHARDAEKVAAALGDTQLVLRTLTAQPGAGLERVS
ncbi:MAG: diphosphomevalonate decarboxylase [Polyangiales bacterium]